MKNSVMPLTFLFMWLSSKEHWDHLGLSFSMGINLEWNKARQTKMNLNTKDSYNKKNVILGVFAKNPVLKLLISKSNIPFNRI